MRNEIVACGDHCCMNLYNRKKQLVGITIFNARHLEKVSAYKWSMLQTGYAFNNTYDILLHRLITGNIKGKVVDHIDGNKLNNLDVNLRICTQQQNTFNMKKIRGIFWDKNKKKWRAHLKLNYKVVFMKRFSNKEDAIQARKEAEKKYFGEFSQ